MKRSRIFFLFLTGLYPLMAGLRLAAQPLATRSVPAVLTNAAQIHLLSFSEAQGRIPVFLRAVITCYDPGYECAFIDDGTAGVCMDLEGQTNNWETGQLIEVRGTSGPGDFAPIILPSQIRVVGKGAVPIPRPVAVSHLLTGKEDCRWVQVQGIVRSVASQDGAVTLEVATSSGPFSARIVGADEDKPPQDLVDATIQVQGVAGAVFNQKRQIVGVRLFVPNLDCVQVVEAGRPDRNSIPSQSIERLLRFDARDGIRHRARIQAAVTLHQPGFFLFVQEGTNAIQVRSAQIEPELHPGDWVDVVGFPAAKDGLSVLEGADYQKIRTGTPPEPLDCPAVEIKQGNLDGRLVRIQATVLEDWIHLDKELMLVLQSDRFIFIAHLVNPNPVAVPASIHKGSQVQVSGVCWNTRSDASLAPTSRLLLRSLGDVVVRHKAPWWTLEHIQVLMGFMTLLFLVALGWAGVLRHQIQGRKRVETALKDQEAFVRNVLDTNPNFIFVKDCDGRFTLVNKAIAGFFGLTVEQMTHRLQTEVHPNREMAEQFLRDDREVMSSLKEKFIAEEITMNQAGDTLWLQTVKRPLISKDGQAYQVLGVATDISARKRVEEQLKCSEELYHSLVQNLPVSVLRKDAIGRFTFGNAHFLAAIDKPFTEILGKTDFDLFPAELAEKYRQDDCRVMENGAVFEATEKHCTPGGETLHVRVLKTPLRDSKDHIVGVQCVFWDITEQERAKEALAYEHDLLDTLMRNIPDHVYFKDAQSRFVRCSSTLVNGLGLNSATQAIGKTDFDFFAAEHAQSAMADEQRIMSTGKPLIGIVEKETWVDGHVTWALTTKMPWSDKQGRIIGTFGVSKDITELKRAQAQIEETHRQLMAASRQAGMAEVATSVLHNVGNVLTSVNVAATLLSDLVKNSRMAMIPKVAALLQEHADEPDFLRAHPKGVQLPGYLTQLGIHLAGEQERLLAEISALAKNVDHIKEIVAMQQNYAKVSGLVDLVAPSELIEDALRLNAEALSRDDVRILRDFVPVPRIVVDKHKVLQILINLIRNAKWACDESGQPDKRIKLSLRSTTPGRLVIQIVDNGVGIPAEHLTRIFSHGFTTRKDGHGFGLHTSALASAEMGGSLSGHSDGPGQGATFTLELPHRSPRT